MVHEIGKPPQVGAIFMCRRRLIQRAAVPLVIARGMFLFRADECVGERVLVPDFA